MKTTIEWVLAVAGGIFGTALTFLGLRSAYRMYVEAIGAKSKVIKELRDIIDGQSLELKKIQLQVDSQEKRQNRTDKYVDDNYNDMRELDKKVDTLKQIQDSKIL